MTEAVMHTEIQREKADDLSESAQPSDLSSNYSQQQQQVEDEVTINIKETTKDCGDGLLLPECCIYRVPITLRQLRKQAYTPKLVSIGPFHYGNERLQDMERHKHILFTRFTQRTKSSLDNLVRLVKSLLPDVRASYSETIELASYSKTIELTEKKLVELILIDAGFIIELFISKEAGEARKDAKLSQPWLEDSIIYDLLLLENQLPFFFIEKLFNRAFPCDYPCNRPSFLELTYDYFSTFNEQDLKATPNVKIKHFTDLLRLFYLPKEMSEKMSAKVSFPDDGSCILLYNANELQEAGIKLKASESKCPLDLKFSGHKLEIPKFCVEDSTELLFRNMIALEQCHYPYDSYITDYAVILDCLVNTYKDVDLLVHNKIVSNYLGDTKNVALLFNGLWKNVTQSRFNSEYRDICKGLNAYCQGCWHKRRATLIRDYCSTPWQIVASIAAMVLLLLTVVQTIFSILQVVKE